MALVSLRQAFRKEPFHKSGLQRNTELISAQLTESSTHSNMGGNRTSQRKSMKMGPEERGLYCKDIT